MDEEGEGRVLGGLAAGLRPYGLLSGADCEWGVVCCVSDDKGAGGGGRENGVVVR